jgi:transcriptional regulator with XRE-family HTH domain
MRIEGSISETAILEELGERLLRHRLNQNLTQKELADEAGTGVNTVYRLEQGQSTQLSNLIRILRALGLVSNLDVLVPESPPSPIEQAKLNKKQRKRASHRRKDESPSINWKWDDES